MADDVYQSKKYYDMTAESRNSGAGADVHC
jgi:hypothetical protein